MLKQPQHLDFIRQQYPSAHLLGCSTAGEICGTRVMDDSLVATAVSFEKTTLKGGRVTLEKVAGSFEAGAYLAQSLPTVVAGEPSGHPEKLAHVFVLSDGLKVNGSDLVRGLTQHLPEGIAVTGGLAGDGARFEETLFGTVSPKRTR